MTEVKEYLIVDGYNIINAWPNLKELAQHNLEDARMKLIDILRDYQGYRGIYIIVVFDAHMTDVLARNYEEYGDLLVVYTSKNETADHFIEKWVNDNGDKYNIRVATSDYLEQTIVLSRGAARVSARELREEILNCKKEIDRVYIQKPKIKINSLDDRLDPDVLRKMEQLRRQT